jgi:hypothetical protein
MGSNKTFQQKGDRGRMLGESSEYRRCATLSRRPQATASAPSAMCRLYGVKALDALPPGIRATALALLDPHI